MVDFKKRLSGKKVEAAIDPVKLYDTLDREHDKGPLRPAQTAVLEEWFRSRREERDIIVKLHTGQGKTLVGLLMLQSRINEKKGPGLYLCPDNFLIEQTVDQARQFGIATCTAAPELPEEFFIGKTILITSVKKLFNGLTKFELHRKSRPVATFLMDDAHACCDRIRESCRIRLPKNDPAYNALRTLFAADLERQGVGTYADICHEKYDALLPIPYWAWMEHESEVANILSGGSTRDTIKYAWPLLKDMLGNCQCIVSGGAIEIEPYIPPLDAFGTYWNAPHRIFMSATVTDDAFLVKGLQLSPETITKPLAYEKERWSGEKMVLIPSLIDQGLNRTEIAHTFGRPSPKRNFGVVVLVPSFNSTKDWENYGATIATKETVGKIVEDLRHGNFGRTMVLVNRYDGIDLPDATCRILIFDGKPYSESLIDLYQESCRPDSAATFIRTVRTVEQGLGRSVRGEKDYSVVIITGPDLTRLVRDKNSRRYVSNQMDTQIEIGLEIASMAKQDIEEGETPKDTFIGLITQCLSRDSGWKAFYAEQMNAVRPSGANERVLQVYATERAAEQKYQSGDYAGAAEEVQRFLDAGPIDGADRGWYLQEMARYNYRSRRSETQRLQTSAYNSNRLLLRPPEGVTVTKLVVVSQGRMERIMAWASQYDNYEQLQVALSDILDQLVFGTVADKFERALDDVSRALGFGGERPDKIWKEGPDNLWALDDTQYILWECKNQVELTRKEINKRETEQMNRSCAWFGKHYPGCRSKNIMIHPTHDVASAAAFTHDVEVMRETELKSLIKRVRQFFKSFESLDFRDLSPVHTQQLINSHNLSVPNLLTGYTKKVRDKVK
jgi:replicative superfamily II helicase